MQALLRRSPRPPHDHSDHHVRDAGDGVMYCAACGDRVRPDSDRRGGHIWTTVDPIDEVWGRLEEAGMLDGPRDQGDRVELATIRGDQLAVGDVVATLGVVVTQAPAFSGFVQSQPAEGVSVTGETERIFLGPDTPCVIVRPRRGAVRVPGDFETVEGDLAVRVPGDFADAPEDEPVRVPGVESELPVMRVLLPELRPGDVVVKDPLLIEQRPRAAGSTSIIVEGRDLRGAVVRYSGRRDHEVVVVRAGAR